MQDENAVQGVRFTYSMRRTWPGAVIIVVVILLWFRMTIHLDAFLHIDPIQMGKTAWFQKLLIGESPVGRLAIMIACELFYLWLLVIQLQGFRRRSTFVYDGVTYFGTTFHGFRASIAAEQVVAFSRGQSYVTVRGSTRNVYIRHQTLDMRPPQVNELCRLLARTLTVNRMYGEAEGPASS